MKKLLLVVVLCLITADTQAYMIPRQPPRLCQWMLWLCALVPQCSLRSPC